MLLQAGYVPIPRLRYGDRLGPVRLDACWVPSAEARGIDSTSGLAWPAE
jgi:hypothetical protein